MAEFLMPTLGADMDAGTIVEWRVQPGDQVHHGDIIAVVDTDKSDIEVEVFEDGVIDEILVEPGDEVPVGTPLARITPAPATGAGQVGTAVVVAPPTPTPTPAPTPAPPKAAKAAAPRARRKRRPAGPPEHVRASPHARRLARERGLDLAAVSGSGPDGAVTAADLPAAPPLTPTEPPPTRRTGSDRQAAMRRATGALMARSKRDIPHYYLATTIDLAAAIRWLTEHNADRPVTERLLPAALLLKATALAARRHPTMNGHWDADFQPAPAIHLGVAVSLRGGGLIAPAIRDADQQGLDGLMGALRDLVERARAGRLRSSETTDPTLTVTNLGDQGADEVFGVIYPPQVALVGFGRVTERPWAVGGLLGVRPTVRATLAADHRVSDGHEGSRFLATIDRLLQDPTQL